MVWSVLTITGAPLVSVSIRHILRLLTPKNDKLAKSCRTCSSRVEAQGGPDTEGQAGMEEEAEPFGLYQG